jgi:hypothetical protein
LRQDRLNKKNAEDNMDFSMNFSKKNTLTSEDNNKVETKDKNIQMKNLNNCIEEEQKSSREDYIPSEERSFAKNQTNKEMNEQTKI